jgi:hypothetical protein
MIRYEDISAAIQVRHLQVRLAEALTFDPSDSADKAARELVSRGFDQAPVIEGGRLTGLVRVVKLREGALLVKDAFDLIEAEDLVSADAPVSRALDWLLAKSCLFVLDGREITGFFLQSDLNKQPARTYFYLLVAGLELALAQRLRWWTGDVEDRVLAVMPEQTRRRVLKERESGHRDDVDADLVAYLNFSEILCLAGRIPEISQALGIRSSESWVELSSGFVGLRTSVMHPTKNLLGRKRLLPALVNLDRSLRQLLMGLEGTAGASLAPRPQETKQP